MSLYRHKNRPHLLIESHVEKENNFLCLRQACIYCLTSLASLKGHWKMLFIFAPWQMMNSDPKRDLIWLSGIRVTIWIFSLTELHTHKLVLTLCLVKLTHSRLAQSSVSAAKPFKRLIFQFSFASKLTLSHRSAPSSICLWYGNPTEVGLLTHSTNYVCVCDNPRCAPLRAALIASPVMLSSQCVCLPHTSTRSGLRAAGTSGALW